MILNPCDIKYTYIYFFDIYDCKIYCQLKIIYCIVNIIFRNCYKSVYLNIVECDFIFQYYWKIFHGNFYILIFLSNNLNSCVKVNPFCFWILHYNLGISGIIRKEDLFNYNNQYLNVYDVPAYFKTYSRNINKYF